MKSYGWLVLFVIAAAAFWPFAIIWSVNTLFGLGLPYTIQTWAAAIVVNAVLSGYGGKRGS